MTRLFTIFAVVGLVFVSLGGQAFALDARCNPDFWTIQKTDAQARVVVDTAQTAAISKQNDSVLVQTCFDKALVKIASAGSIFSDKALGNITSLTEAALAGFNGANAGAPYILGQVTKYLTTGPSAGARGPATLLENLDNTISEVLTGLMNDFVGSLLGNLTVSISSSLSNALGQYFGGANGAIYNAINNLLGNQLGYQFECGITEARSMLRNWRDNIVGQGLSASVIDVDEALAYAALGIMPPEGFNPAFKAKLDNRYNKQILQRAYHDNQVNLPVPTSPLTFVKSIPALFVDSTIEEVIRAMDEIEEKPGYIPMPSVTSSLSVDYTTN